MTALVRDSRKSTHSLPLCLPITICCVLVTVCLELSMPRDFVLLVCHGGEILHTYHSNQDDFQVDLQICIILKVGVYMWQLKFLLNSQALSWFISISFHGLWRDLIKQLHIRNCYSYHIILDCFDGIFVVRFRMTVGLFSYSCAL